MVKIEVGAGPNVSTVATAKPAWTSNIMRSYVLVLFNIELNYFEIY